jgi:hypothetical protein
LTMQA